MLKKILEDMFIPEEILNNITDDDKQLIFIEIRQEQIRRYNAWQNSGIFSEEFHHRPNVKGKNIKFADENELFCVLGERPFDRPIEDILREETLERAKEEAERAVLLELDVVLTEKVDDVKRAELPSNAMEERTPVSTNPTISPNTVSDPAKRGQPEKPPKPLGRRLMKNSDQKLEEMKKRKSTEIYHSLISQQNVLEETAIKENEKLAPIWEKSEEHARIVEEQRRKKALEARKFYDNISKERGHDVLDTINISDKRAPPLPTQKSSQLRYVLSAISNFEILSKTGKDKSDIKSWFLENEWNKKRIIDKVTNKVPDWFHGMISRQQSEKLLSTMGAGCFLLRVSEKCFCYVLSYNAKSKVKHILIQSNVDIDQYEFLGPPNATVFKSLKDLIEHFQSHVLSDINQDILTRPCCQVPGATVDYIALITPDSSQADKKPVHKCAI